MYRYTVRCEFTKPDPEIIQRWLDWLKEPHIADVMRGGACGAEVVEMQCACPTFEIRYRFPDKTVFQQYLSEFAPGLRAEGLELFPPEKLGMVYSRSDGEVIHDQGS